MAQANPKIRSTFFSVYPNAAGTQLDNLPSQSGHCGVCHYNFKNGGDPWSPYGQSIKNVGGLNSEAGRTNAIWSVRNLDQDGDGYTALTEITAVGYANTPTFPGLAPANVNQVVNVQQSDVQPYLTPTTVSDTTPPAVTVLSPNGGETFVANRPTNVTWAATDPSGVVAIHIYLSLDNGATFSTIAQGLPNTGSYSWVPADRPTANTARIKVVAVDGAANSTNDLSNAAFTIVSPAFTNMHGVASTLRDFDMPGTQPFEGGPELSNPSECAVCHGNYNPSVEPYFNWQGSMMAHASLDPLFLANMAIANQDAPNSGDLCLRCHFSRGWLQGRSVLTDGSRMLASDTIGVSCDLCHRMVDPVYVPGVSPAVDADIIAALSFPGTNNGNGMVSICQDCHMPDVAGQGCNITNNPTVTTRNDLPLHDMTGGSTWLPGLLTNLFPTQVNAAAIEAGIGRATYMVQHAASLSVGDATGQIKVTVTNECGHKLPTGYPEGRRIWLNVQFYDESTNLLAESGMYDTSTGVLTHDAAVKIYEVHPGIDTNLSGLLGLDAAPSLHFVLNNKIYEDNRIPPRGFTNANFAAFGGAPVGHSYADGQYWDETLYTLPTGAARAEVKLYYQSTSKEFVEFLRDENTTNTKGQEMYDLWNNNGKCPPTLMASATWVLAFQLEQVGFNGEGELEFHFLARPGTTYTIQYTDNLTGTPIWHDFNNAGTLVATETESEFKDDFTSSTSGGPSATGARFYRFSWLTP